MKTLGTLAFALLVGAASATAGEVVEKLPAGGKYVFQTNWDKYTILCTADPQQPTVLQRVCTCTQYDRKPWTGDYKFRLSLTSLLSNGKSAELTLADALDGMGDCEIQKAKAVACK